MQVIRFTAAPVECGAYGEGAIKLYDDHDSGLCKGARGKKPLYELIEDEFTARIAPGSVLEESLRRSIKINPGRIIIVTHGFEYEPREGEAEPPRRHPNPHNAIFHNRDEVPVEREHHTKETPWLTRLEPKEDDLVIAYAFSSDPGKISTGNWGKGRLKSLRQNRRRLMGMVEWNGGVENTFAHAYSLAAHYALGLAEIVAVLSRLWGDEGPRISFVAHSLGARIVTAVLRRLCRQYSDTDAIEKIDRVILMAAALASHQVAGLGRDKWLLSRKLGFEREPKIEIFNFTSQSDTVLTLIGAPLAADIGKWLEAQEADPDLACARKVLNARSRGGASALAILIGNLRRRDRIVGVHGGGSASDWLNWIDIPLDHPQTRLWGEIANLSLAGDLESCKRDHWVHYTHRPNWELYRNILNDPENWNLRAIRTGKVPDGVDPSTNEPKWRTIRPPLTARPDEQYEPVVVSATPRPASP